MGDDYRRKIECEMDRFEAEISSLGRPGPGMGGGPPPQMPPVNAFIPAQLRRVPAPPPPHHLASGGGSSITGAPVISRQPAPVTISGAPQVYRPPTVRPRIPLPQTTSTQIRVARPGIRIPPPPGAVISAAPTTFSARPTTITSPPVVSGQPVPATPTGFTPIAPGSMPINIPPSMPASLSSIPLPPEQSASSSSMEAKPSTSSASAGTSGGDDGDKGKGKKKKEKKPKKLVRCAGGTVWEDPSLQDWDPSDFRLFCGDLGNDVTDEVLTRVFGRYPSFQKARVIRDKRTNKTKGYGFVSFKDPNDFSRAVKELDGRYVGSRPIKLRKSNWKNRNVEVVRKREIEKLALLGIHKKPKLF